MSRMGELVSDCFKKSGWLTTTKGFRYEPAQEAYALDVLEWLTGKADKPVALIEGDTGVGKTLAYLVPLFVYVRITGGRGVVATHTINLQNQMLESDVGIANEYLEISGLLPCQVQQLIGRQAFIDPVKIEYRLKSLNESGYIVSQSKELISEAYQCSLVDGLIESFYLQIGGEPDFLPANDICIDEDSDVDINAGFDRQREQAKFSDIVITSHTMLLLNRSHAGSSIFENSELPISAIIIDEADLLEASAEIYSSKRIHPKQISNSLSKLYEKLTAKEKNLFSQLKSTLSELDTELRKFGASRYKQEPILFSSMQSETRQKILDKLSQINSHCDSFSSIFKLQNLGVDLEFARDDFIEISEFISKFCVAARSNESTCGINWSDTHGIPSLQIAQPYPARRIKNYIFSADRHVCRLMLTSATLSDGRDKGFVSTKASIQLFGDTHYSVQSSHSPKEFGSVNFVLTDNSVSQPISIASEQITFNSEWLNHVAAVVTEASHNGNALVLANSFAEAESIFRRIKVENNIHLHRSGINLKTVIADFQARGGILITPSAWEGVSIRSFSGKQHFTQLVITRAPYSPPDKFKEIVMRAYLNENGIVEPKASSIIRGKSILTTVRKLRQGIGRLIRHYADSGTIWICDPRIPPYGSATIHKQDNGLIRAIPHRFMDSYKSALVFDSLGKSFLTNKGVINVPCEIEEWL